MNRYNFAQKILVELGILAEASVELILLSDD
jgi:hypothetical protein